MKKLLFILAFPFIFLISFLQAILSHPFRFNCSEYNSRTQENEKVKLEIERLKLDIELKKQQLNNNVKN